LPSKLIHPTRITNSTNMQRESKRKLNLPPANSSKWHQINEDLAALIPRIFNKAVVSSLSTSELSVKFDDWLYTYFDDNFGTVPPSNPTKNKRRKRSHKGLERLRQRKKECKAARKALVRAGLEKTAEADLISKQWFSLVREHSRLKKTLDQKKEMKSRVSCEKNFEQTQINLLPIYFKGNKKMALPLSQQRQQKNTLRKLTEMRIEITLFQHSQKCHAHNFLLHFFHCAVLQRQKLERVFAGKEMEQHQDSMACLIYRTRNVLQSKTLCTYSHKKYGKQEMCLQTGQKLLLSSCQNQTTCQLFQNSVQLQLLQQLVKSFSQSFQKDFKVLWCRTIIYLELFKKGF